MRRVLRSTAITRAPSLASRSDVARPIPDPAPVTIMVLPRKRPGMIPSFQFRGDGGGADGNRCASSGLVGASETPWFAASTSRFSCSAVTLPRERVMIEDNGRSWMA